VLLDFETAVPALSSVVNEYGADIRRETLSEMQPIQSPLMIKKIQLDEGSLTAKIAKNDQA
jgi:hypothetical protein